MNNLKFKLMTKKNLFLVALAAVAFAACSDDFADAPPVVTPTPENYEIPIVFSSASNGSMTRADITGAAAADLLGGKFVVSGYKGTTSSPATPNIVYENFLVEWHENTANTTESNTANWEYVGVKPIKHAVDKGIARQAIKYWDYTYSQYDFIAWSTGKKTAIYEKPAGGIPSGSVYVTRIDPSKTTTAAYTFEGSAADLSQCYIADLVTVKKDPTTKGTYGDKGAYGDPVVLTFRSLGTKVRIGIYETIPGYSVRNVRFYPQAGTLADADDITTEAKIFTASADVYQKGTYTVKFPTVNTPADANNNQAHITFAGDATDQTTIVNYGTLNYTIAEEAEQTPGNVFLGRSSNTATFAGDASKNYYKYYLPNETGTNFNLRVDFTLESIDGTGEIIEVKNASAQVPLVYTQWKPGFAYTYLFKISDKTNGRTGPYDPTKPDTDPYNADPNDKAGLYPITFDALVVDAEDNGHTQETITTITTPSITTYQQASTVVNADEYTENGKDIFVTVNENDALVSLEGKAALYTIPAGKTEAEVIDALQMQDDLTTGSAIIGRNGLKLDVLTMGSTGDYNLTSTVEYGADGNVINVGANKALRFTPSTGKTYAFVYTQTASTSTLDMFQPVTKAANASVSGLYRYALKAALGGDVEPGVFYFADATSNNKDVFLGQNVGNLYINTGTAAAPVYTVASGRAASGTTYYYTTDKGMHYTAATNITFAAFTTATDLYTFNGTTYVIKPASVVKPVDGTAYYQLTNVGGTDVYTLCVILPEQSDGLYVLDATAKVACGTSEVAYTGQTYFDKYTKNNAVNYAKIIKVQ